MAWHIPPEKMNNQPLPKEVVVKRYEEKGYKIIDYTYKNNSTKMTCYDGEGYKVRISLDSLRTNTKQYARFSPSCNEENFMFNVRRYYSLNPELPEPLDWKYKIVGDNKKHIYLKCVCPECSEIFWTDFTTWRNKTKILCNRCSALMSGYERKVQRWLDENKVNYIQQERFDDCRDKKPLPFDFYIPEQNMCIEVDGEQHFYNTAKIRSHRFTQEEFEVLQKHDKIKTEYCKNKGINLLRISFMQFRTDKYIQTLKEQIITNKI